MSVRTVAVEDSLTNISDVLRKEGYQVVPVDRYRYADAVVVNGMDNNVLNMQDIVTRVSVIDARGKTPEEVLDRLQKII